MRSSSTDPTAPGGGSAGRRGFWPTDTGAWTRLSLVVVLGTAALVAPSVGATTGAIYTDTETAGFDVIPGPSPTTPAAESTTEPAPETSTDPAATALQAPAALTAPAATDDPAVASVTPPDPGATATPTPAPTPTQQTETDQGRSHTPWPAWPPHRGR